MALRSLMQRSTGPSCCSRPCQQQALPGFCPARSLHVHAKPSMHSSRTSTVVASSSPRDEAGIDDDEWARLRAEWELGWLLKRRAPLQTALLKAPFQLVGGVGVLVYAFGDFGHSSGQLTLNPNFPAGVPGLVVVLMAFVAICESFYDPTVQYIFWKGKERRCVKYWGKEVVDHILQGPSSQSQKPPQAHSEQYERVEGIVRESLIEDLPDKHEELDEALKWSVYKLIGAFALYKCVVEDSSPYHASWLQLGLSWLQIDPAVSELFSVMVPIILVSTPIQAIGNVVDQYIELNIHERNCVAWCGEDSIKSYSVYVYHQLPHGYGGLVCCCAQLVTRCMGNCTRSKLPS